MIQIKLNDQQANKLTSLLLVYLDANDHDEQMRELLYTINFGEEFTQSDDKGTLKQY
jgi:hypothetical protein